MRLSWRKLFALLPVVGMAIASVGLSRITYAQEISIVKLYTEFGRAMVIKPNGCSSRVIDARKPNGPTQGPWASAYVIDCKFEGRLAKFFAGSLDEPSLARFAPKDLHVDDVENAINAFVARYKIPIKPALIAITSGSSRWDNYGYFFYNGALYENEEARARRNRNGVQQIVQFHVEGFRHDKGSIAILGFSEFQPESNQPSHLRVNAASGSFQAVMASLRFLPFQID